MGLTHLSEGVYMVVGVTQEHFQGNILYTAPQSFNNLSTTLLQSDTSNKVS